MKRAITWGLLALLFVIGLMVAGCSKGGSPGSSTPVPTQSQPSGQSIADLINKAKQVESLSLDYNATTPDGKKTSGTIWGQMGKMMKIETTSIGVQSVMLVNLADNTVTIYEPATKRGMKIKESALGQKKTKTANDYLKEIDPKVVKDLGTAVINGQTCRIIQYTSASDPTITEKMWLAEDLGYPVQITSTTADNKTTEIYYTNIKIGALPSDIFTIPAGVEIKDMTKN